MTSKISIDAARDAARNRGYGIVQIVPCGQKSGVPQKNTSGEVGDTRHEQHCSPGSQICRDRSAARNPHRHRRSARAARRQLTVRSVPARLRWSMETAQQTNGQ
jgi:hypothetical protein